MLETINKSFKNIEESFVVLFLSQNDLLPVCKFHFPSFYEELLRSDYFKSRSVSGQNDVFIFEVNKEQSEIKKSCIIGIKIKDYKFESYKTTLVNLKNGLETLVNKTLPALLSDENKEVSEFTKETPVAIKLLGQSSLLPSQTSKDLFENILGKSDFNFKVYTK